MARERIVLVTTVRSANANARNRNKTERYVVSYFASAMASTAACRSAPNFVPISALDAFDCACAAASRPRALPTCVASRAPANPHDAPTCRKSATNAPNRDAAAATMRALLDALPAACGSYSPTATLNRPRTPIRKHHIITKLMRAQRLTWRICRARQRARQDRHTQRASQRNLARCRTTSSRHLRRGKL